MAVQLVKAVAAVAHLTKSDVISISIIIPILNESEQLADALRHLFDAIDTRNTEVILCDGDSKDNSLDIAGEFQCQIIRSKPGRARQMNQASQIARGDWLLFLHADSRLPKHWQQAVLNARQWGFFRVRFSSRRWPLRMIENAMHLRSKITYVATGDQGLFFRQTFFKRLCGFPEIPIMEDIAISKQARRLSRPSLVSAAMTTSSRRWEKNGWIKTMLLMWWLRLAYWLGVSPRHLRQIYYPDHTD